MTRLVAILVLSLAACTTDETPGLGGPTDASTPDFAADLGTEPDTRTDDAAPDEPDTGTDTGTDLGLTGCAALSAADCMADVSCTLDGGCTDISADDLPFDYLQTSNWEGIALSEGDKSFPTGETAATFSIFRSGPRDLRGVLILPDHGVRHAVWGGVGPTGELGVYFGPAECPNPAICNVAFAPAYEAGGLATDLTISFDDVTADSAVVDFRTFISLELAPSDGFKPVNPVQTRIEPLAAMWRGDIVAVDEAGNVLELYCEFTIDSTRDGYAFSSVECFDDGNTLAATVTAADSGSIAHANDVGWFALGPDDDDLLFVGRVGVDGPWSGVIARRGDVWTNGNPIDPGDVPVESLRGTFTFHALLLNP